MLPLYLILIVPRSPAIPGQCAFFTNYVETKEREQCGWTVRGGCIDVDMDMDMDMCAHIHANEYMDMYASTCPLGDTVLFYLMLSLLSGSTGVQTG